MTPWTTSGTLLSRYVGSILDNISSIVTVKFNLSLQLLQHFADDLVAVRTKVALIRTFQSFSNDDQIFRPIISQ